jgi:hypothetical protein
MAASFGNGAKQSDRGTATTNTSGSILWLVKGEKVLLLVTMQECEPCGMVEWGKSRRERQRDGVV